MAWFDKSTAADFKKSRTDKDGNWLDPTDKIKHGVLVKDEAGIIKHKTPEQIEREEKAKDKADERKRVIEEKKKWEDQQ